MKTPASHENDKNEEIAMSLIKNIFGLVKSLNLEHHEQHLWLLKSPMPVTLIPQAHLTWLSRS